MCGIAGTFELDGESFPDEALVGRMTDALAHRGPDDAGLLVDAPVALGNRRLAILDLSPAGHQPMATEDGGLWITYNGEIYNYVELADELCGQLHAPLEFRELAVLAARLDSLVVPGARAPSEPTWLLSVYESADAFRRPARFQLWLQVLAARAQAAGIASADSSALQARLQSGLAAAAAVHLSAQELPGLRGPAIGARLHALRLAAIDRA